MLKHILSFFKKTYKLEFILPGILSDETKQNTIDVFDDYINKKLLTKYYITVYDTQTKFVFKSKHKDVLTYIHIQFALSSKAIHNKNDKLEMINKNKADC